MIVSDLNGRQRVLILMMALERHTAGEIAEAVGVPEAVVRQLCRDAEISLPRTSGKEKQEAKT